MIVVSRAHGDGSRPIKVVVAAGPMWRNTNTLTHVGILPPSLSFPTCSASASARRIQGRSLTE